MAAETIRFTRGPQFDLEMTQRLLSSRMDQYAGIIVGSPAIGNGTTVGFLRTTASATVMVGGRQIAKASTDDLWDLTGVTDLVAAQFQAHWLFINSAGIASLGSGTVATSAAAALLALPALDFTKGVLGIYVAGPSADYDIALAAQGTLTNGISAGANCGMSAYGLGFLEKDWTTIRKP